MKLFKNKNSLHKTKEGQPSAEVAAKVGSLMLKEGAAHVEEDGRTVVDDLHLLATDLVERGFTTVSSGRGPWVKDGDARIIDELAIKHPDGQVVAVSTYKVYTPSGTTMRSYPYLEELNAEAYEGHVAEWQITTSPDQAIDVLIEPPQPEA